GRLFDIEYVVDNLKSEADVLAITGKGCQLWGIGAGENAAEAQAGAQQGAGFGMMNGFEQSGIGLAAFAFDIMHLSGNHAADATGGLGEFLDELNALRRFTIGGGQNLKSEGTQGV